MKKSVYAVAMAMIALIAVAGLAGCQNSSGGEGVHVMFKGVPKIHHTAVYHHGRAVGSILEQATAVGGATMVTIRIAPEYRQHAGEHWAFYVDMGRLTAGRLNTSGNPVKPGDRMCGFHSKAALNWFKIKTVLSHRISEAGRRAEKLHRRFTRSG